MRALMAGITILVAVSQTANGQETWAERLGYPAGKRVVILYADTMGASYEFNRPGQELLANGHLNSASVMAPCPWFEEFAAWCRENPQHDIGVCLTLNSPGTALSLASADRTEQQDIHAGRSQRLYVEHGIAIGVDGRSGRYSPRDRGPDRQGPRCRDPTDAPASLHGRVVHAGRSPEDLSGDSGKELVAGGRFGTDSRENPAISRRRVSAVG